ncbi:type II/IV secretion system protein [Polynucleobacter sp. AP-Elch-400A-B2]|uniref:GspE/PulE family protein n=1 Tax=Polynucleobacter sp. AP-Elch-400A-B2 TaxID=2576930 RepID=UPI001BFDA805|nr:GspE/PulE family protein [Polynucleobacter sp. AP-Elch-400A-B2]QWE24865.1 type II/IV secretion system protein [Polynucleobacter sp. AP-Elch-400A-B2]
MSDLLHDSHIIRTWHDIAVNALNHRATDIHIEARSQETVVRTRIDGRLTLQNQYPIDFHERLITRIKILARLDIAEKRLPQDGRLVIGHDFSHPNIDCRVSILPTLHGEKAVVRILPSCLEELALDQIGLLPEQLGIVQEAISQTNGLILVTGPTGSGKTRTLYSCLSSLNHVQRNICSVEDPIEIRLPGINQVAYHPKAGLDFPVIIRALLRQDPDVIMIGEIRDAASAQIAIQAAQTGHLVLSTLHTRNAIGALSRLKSLGVDQESIESCLRCVSSQRLIRKLCNQCNLNLSKAPCKLCKGSGYFGRIGIHEVLGSKQLFESAQALDIYSAGTQLLKSGLIDQISLDAELGSWH